MHRLFIRHALSLAALLSSSPAVAAEWLVQDEGVHGAVQATVEQASDGDEVRIAPGVYPGSVDTLGKSLRIIGAGIGATRLDVGCGIDDGEGFHFHHGVGDASLQHLTIAASCSAGEVGPGLRVGGEIGGLVSVGPLVATGTMPRISGGSPSLVWSDLTVELQAPDCEEGRVLRAGLSGKLATRIAYLSQCSVETSHRILTVQNLLIRSGTGSAEESLTEEPGALNIPSDTLPSYDVDTIEHVSVVMDRCGYDGSEYPGAGCVALKYQDWDYDVAPHVSQLVVALDNGLAIHASPQSWVDFPNPWSISDSLFWPGPRGVLVYSRPWWFRSLFTQGNLAADPRFVRWTADGDVRNDDLCAGPLSPLRDAGIGGELDPDGSPADLGAFGGPGAFACGAATDADGDGFMPITGDCDDGTAGVRPWGGEPHCDGLDEDCDGAVDEECGPIAVRSAPTGNEATRTPPELRIATNPPRTIARALHGRPFTLSALAAGAAALLYFPGLRHRRDHVRGGPRSMDSNDRGTRP